MTVTEVEITRLEAYEPTEVCRSSLHPDHTPCNEPAIYLVSWVDVTCAEPGSRSACSFHAPILFRSALLVQWCPCPSPHEGHVTAYARIDRLSS